ncbi:helix-turn-helix domain-containing protein [Erysipelothrix sp. HDW6A]|uniref:helix-turn-helix transcriptional regulator n=1 Tax=Erysipelothrix sp. HDW6A TaxID=2714928 RepID=UPI00140C2E7D|nr:helix-turn-helix domain-containing protein [Erysipelothrix sp. HDW6A]QIK57801.1 helix-turn-helix domain-containing protein [Erysipelothrix sp. HDW6A]
MKYTLKELRAKNNQSQTDVAKAVGVSVQTYCSWEKDYNQIKIGNANKIANHFRVTLDDIFFTKKHENYSCKNEC